MAKNGNLNRAGKEKNDEFYTQIADIEREMGHYVEHFRGKTIFLNCDDPLESNFWLYFQLNFYQLGLKKLVSTHYEESKPSYKLEVICNSIEQEEGIKKGTPDYISFESVKHHSKYITKKPYLTTGLFICARPCFSWISSTNDIRKRLSLCCCIVIATQNP